MANKWLVHVKKTMKSNHGMKFKDVLKLAGKTYKKTGSSPGHTKSKRRKHKRTKSKGKGKTKTKRRRKSRR